MIESRGRGYKITLATNIPKRVPTMKPEKEEIRARLPSIRLSVGFGTDSTMTPNRGKIESVRGKDAIP